MMTAPDTPPIKDKTTVMPHGATPVAGVDRLILNVMLGAKAAWQARPGNPKEKELLDNLAKVSAKHGLKPPPLIIYRSKRPNAVSLISGHIAVSSDLMDITTPQQMKAVLGHEMSHHRHRPRDLALLLGTLMGGSLAYRRLGKPHVDKLFAARKAPHIGELAQTLGEEIAGLEIAKAYQRGCEYEADREGAHATAPKEMSGALRALEKRAEQLGDEEFEKRQKAFDKKPAWEKSVRSMLDELEPRWVKRIRLNPMSLLDGHPRMSARLARLDAMEPSEQTLSSDAISR